MQSICCYPWGPIPIIVKSFSMDTDKCVEPPPPYHLRRHMCCRPIKKKLTVVAAIAHQCPFQKLKYLNSAKSLNNIYTDL